MNDLQKDAEKYVQNVTKVKEPVTVNDWDRSFEALEGWVTCKLDNLKVKEKTSDLGLYLGESEEKANALIARIIIVSDGIGLMKDGEPACSGEIFVAERAMLMPIDLDENLYATKKQHIIARLK